MAAPVLLLGEGNDQGREGKGREGEPNIFINTRFIFTRSSENGGRSDFTDSLYL